MGRGISSDLKRPTHPHEMIRELQVFENNVFGKITAITKDGEPWFVAKEISDILRYSGTDKLTRRLDDDEKADHPFWSISSNQYRNQQL